MNIKLITLTAAVAMTAAMAQERLITSADAPASAPAFEEATAPASEPTPAPAPAPAPAPKAQTLILAPQAAPAPAQEEAPAAKPALHGIAYNNVGNQAADATVADNLNKPYKMAGSKFVYLEPTSRFSAVSFGEGSTKFISFENAGNLGRTTVGIANKGFGASISYAFGKELTFTKTRDPFHEETEDLYTVSAGDMVRARFALPLGGIDLNASLFWLTYQTEPSVSMGDEDADENVMVDIENDFWDFGGTVAVSNDPSAKKMFWNAAVTFTRHENAYSKETTIKSREDGTKTTKVDTTGKDANVYIQPALNIGATILQGNGARVLLGLNTRAPFVFYDEFDDKAHQNKDEYFTMGIYTQPNIFAEIALGNCWMVYGGADYTWTLFSMEDEDFIENYEDEISIVKSSATKIRSLTGATRVNLGLRFQYNNFAVEASIENTFYSNPFRGFSDENNNILANFGGFIYF